MLERDGVTGASEECTVGQPVSQDEALAPRDRPSVVGELGGAFADLGVLIPLEAALIAINGLNPTTSLVGVGMAYIVAGRYFRIPMPVQPLKAFAAIAIATHARPEVIAAGALLMSVALTVLAATGLITALSRWTPIGVVRGVQLGLGLLLLKSGWEFVVAKPFLIDGTRATFLLAGRTISWAIPLALAGGALLLILLRLRRLPASLVLLLVGGVVGVLAVPAGQFASLSLGPAGWTPHLPQMNDFAVALSLLVIPQLPLTLANSVLATHDAAAQYFGRQAARATPRALSVSIAAGNLWAGLAGGLPICHGCGGLTAHYRFGARTPLSTTILGGLLIVVGVALGAAALEVRSLVPYAVYGVLLLYVGVEHFKLGWAVPHRAARVVALLTAGVAMLFGGNLAYGAAAGLLMATGIRLGRYLSSIRAPASQ